MSAAKFRTFQSAAATAAAKLAVSGFTKAPERFRSCAAGSRFETAKALVT